MGERSGDGGWETLWGKQLLSELETLGGQWCGCFRHDLHTAGVWSVRFGIFADYDPGGGAEVAELVG